MNFMLICTPLGQIFTSPEMQGEYISALPLKISLTYRGSVDGLGSVGSVGSMRSVLSVVSVVSVGSVEMGGVLEIWVVLGVWGVWMVLGVWGVWGV